MIFKVRQRALDGSVPCSAAARAFKGYSDRRRGGDGGGVGARYRHRPFRDQEKLAEW